MLYDLLGVGVGPFNLSVAALMSKVNETSSIFLERKKEFCWYPGMLIPNSYLQISFLKDLVTAADPTSPYSFLSYIVQKGRFYRFINAEYSFVERKEFADYLAWVAARLDNVKFNQNVKEIELTDTAFVVHSQDQTYLTKNLIMGTGITPNIPESLKSLFSEKCFHSHEYMMRGEDFSGKRVVVIGGGQSGVEILLDIIKRYSLVESVVLFTRRNSLEVLDDSPFINEFFSPDYARFFYKLDPSKKKKIVEQQKLASDGVSRNSLIELIQTLYAHDFINPESNRKVRVYPCHEVINAKNNNSEILLKVRDNHNHREISFNADIVICATGYKTFIPDMLEPFFDKLPKDNLGNLDILEDFSVNHRWQHGGKLFIQNQSRNTYGIFDPQMSLAAWRSAKIINSLLGKKAYYENEIHAALNWEIA